MRNVKSWRKLDNAAKIFPATSGKVDERVFRDVCELNEEINPEALQKALDTTIEIFPVFQCVLRSGAFWYYLEDRDIRPMVEEEHTAPCSRIYVHDQKNLLFRVSYYGKRINLEVFHALTDATGSSQFLRTLVYAYLKNVHPEQITGPVYTYDATDVDKEEDSFAKYYAKVDKNIKIPKYKAYQITGRKHTAMQVIEGRVSVSGVLAEARARGVTLTVLLTAVFLKAISMEFSPTQKNRIAALMIPVNMRTFFPSSSARNYFSWIDIGYDFSANSGELEDIILFVKEFFQTELTPERLAVRNNSFVKMEKNVFARVLPLPIKTLGMKLAMKTSAGDTAIFSNAGKVEMPPECAPFIRFFEAFITTPKLQICSRSYGDNLMLCFTTPYTNTNIIRNFFRMLTEMKLEVEISTNISD